ncbi:MAG: response regulator transcription factor [Clostridia bacterium]|nr:response regulator transcription factor [Clostridia bacterium]
MYQTAIVEDNERERETLKAYLERYSDLFSVSVFSSAVDFLTNYVPKYDLVFMDIDMPYLDGMSAAKKLRETDDKVCIIFVTNLAKFAIKGYEVSAFDFIVKPVAYSNFALKMDRVMNHFAAKTEKEVLIRTEGNLVRVSVSNICYAEITNHKIVYHTVEKEIVSYGTLKSVEELLNDPLFVRCNKCYLVNLRFVSAIEGSFAIVGKDKLLISYPRRASFEKALADYLCGQR